MQSIEKSTNARELCERLLVSIVEDPGIPIIGGRVWHKNGGRFRLVSRVGGRKPLPIGTTVQFGEALLGRLVREKSLYAEPGDLEYDEKIESELGVREFAAISVGEANDFLIAFDVTTKKFEDRQQILSFLDIVRHVINYNLEQRRYEAIFLEARDIQLSILPKTIPQLPGYDIYGESLPAEKEKVGGDLFDFVEMAGGGMAIIIADASGHGLPAALMARDVHTAIHMGMMGEIKITRMIERINRILCRDSLTGKFTTLFYGEVDPLNQMVYTSAGHPALVYSHGNFHLLREGGPILGINPDVHYMRGTYKLKAGDVVCLYTDGITEARNGAGKEFGEERLREIIRRSRNSGAKEICRRILKAAETWAHADQDDDRTIVVAIRRK
ncbi:MAG: PP2C family protein-serine/threonine phosphatase [Planctomycetes bacterium]|nr:PP2C family protein-serine/threonine phosphatase [Planctomycetota bacterium]MBI3844999.1 PP2C family protein-serine/threonine phosphatase [Planctomycetota bacterium]